MGTEDWLIVDNRTDSEVFITDADVDLRNSLRDNETTGFDILGSIGAGSQGWVPGRWSNAMPAPSWPTPGHPTGRW